MTLRCLFGLWGWILLPALVKVIVSWLLWVSSRRLLLTSLELLMKSAITRCAFTHVIVVPFLFLVDIFAAENASHDFLFILIVYRHLKISPLFFVVRASLGSSLWWHSSRLVLVFIYRGARDTRTDNCTVTSLDCTVWIVWSDRGQSWPSIDTFMGKGWVNRLRCWHRWLLHITSQQTWMVRFPGHAQFLPWLWLVITNSLFKVVLVLIILMTHWEQVCRILKKSRLLLYPLLKA